VRFAFRELLPRASLVLFVCLSAAVAAAQPATDARLASADAAMRAGRFADAAREYEALLKARPDSARILLALGMCYVQLGRPEEAAGLLRRHVKLAPGSAAGHAALGVALLDGARTAEARAALETAVRLDPRQADAVKALSRIHLVEGRPAEAAELLRPLAESAGGEEARLLLADALVRAGQAREAGRLLDRELQANPQSPPQTYALAAWVHLKAGEAAKAAEVCERGTRLYPGSEIETVYLSLPGPLFAERVGERIKRLQESPRVDELLALGSVLILADPARKTRANEIARRLLSHAVELAPDSAPARYHYGRALSQSSPEAALKEWEKALTLNPTPELRVRALSRIAAAKVDNSDFEGADRAYRAAVEINRKLPQRDVHSLLEYVRFLQLTERKAEAEALIEEALRVNPLSPEAHMERAKLLGARGQWAEAAAEGEFVLRNAGEDEQLLRSAHTLLARAYFALKQPEKARAHQSWLASR
jgi:tetratricopeptide (TPR) repeat protein